MGVRPVEGMGDGIGFGHGACLLALGWTKHGPDEVLRRGDGAERVPQARVLWKVGHRQGGWWKVASGVVEDFKPQNIECRTAES